MSFSFLQTYCATFDKSIITEPFFFVTFVHLVRKRSSPVNAGFAGDRPTFLIAFPDERGFLGVGADRYRGSPANVILAGADLACRRAPPARTFANK